MHFSSTTIQWLREGSIYMMDIDINISSCIEGVNAKTCKNLLDIMPNRFLKIFAKSLSLGIFPGK